MKMLKNQIFKSMFISLITFLFLFPKYGITSLKDTDVFLALGTYFQIVHCDGKWECATS